MSIPKPYKVSLILILLGLFLGACEFGPGPVPSPEPPEPRPFVPDNQDSDSTIGKILERGRINAGIRDDFKPFGYLDENDEIVGFDVDIVREFARRWLGDEKAIEPIKLTSADRIERLAAGEVDLVATAMTHKKDREEKIDFSQTYFLDGQSLLVQDGSGINGVADLDGKKVAAIEGSTSIDQIREEAEKQGVTIEIVPFQEYPVAVKELIAGKVDALTTDSIALSRFAEDNPGLIVVGGQFTKEPYGIGVPQGDYRFRELVNFTLQNMKKDGTYDDIYNKWFSDTPYDVRILPGESPSTSLQDFPAMTNPIIPSEQSESTISQILERGYIKAGIRDDFKPFGYLDENGNTVGFDIDIVREFARRWLEDEKAIEPIKLTSADRIERLAAGEVDLVATAMTHKKDREEKIDFSQTYFLDGQSLLVQDGSGINGVADLNGKKVAAIEGSTSIDQIQKEAERLGVTIEIVPFQEYPVAVKELIAGKVDALTTDSVALSQFAEDNPGLIVVGGQFTKEPYGIGVPQGDSHFRELVDFTLQEMKKDGTYGKIYQKWFPDQSPYPVDILPGDPDYLLALYEVHIVPNISAIKDIRERGKLIVGVRYDLPPFGFLNNGQESGFDVDLIKAIAEQWDVEVEFVQVKAGTVLPKLEKGEVDILAAALVHRKSESEKIDFSQTYFYDGQILLVRKESQIGGVSDLNDKVVAVVSEADAARIQAVAAVNKISIQTQPFEEYNAALSALINGDVAALTANNAPLSHAAKDHEDLIVVGGLLSQAPYALGLPSNDSYFNNLINFTLQELKENGKYNDIYQQWFGRQPNRRRDLEVLPGEWPYTFADSPTTLDKAVKSKITKISSSDCTFNAGVKYDFSPFGFLDENGDVVGFDVDIVKEFAKRWCGDEETVKLVEVTSQNRLIKLEKGEVDILAASMTHTKDRDDKIDFSQTYFQDGQSLLVRQNSGITDTAGLDGKIVAAIEGSTSIKNIQAEADKLGITIKIQPYKGYPPAIEALKAGDVDVLTTDRLALLRFAEENPGLIVVGERFTKEPYGLGVPNYDDRFRDLVNFTLQEMKLDGTYNRLYNKWFPDEQPYPIEIWQDESYLEVHTVPMQRIPEGEFMQGRDDGLGDEKPERTIFVDEFYIDQYEVTNRLYDQCVRAGPCHIPPDLPVYENFSDYYVDSALASHPVVWVSWKDAAAYCQFAGKRLPTEAEWEKVARGPLPEPDEPRRIYPWGDKDKPPTPELANFGYHNRNAMPVGSYPEDVSVYGVYDIAGNVREWVADWYQHDYYQKGPQENPQGPSSGTTKVVRGGGWSDTEILNATTTRRQDSLPDSSDHNLGFRCASSTFPPAR